MAAATAGTLRVDTAACGDDADAGSAAFCGDHVNQMKCKDDYGSQNINTYQCRAVLWEWRDVLRQQHVLWLQISVNDLAACVQEV